MRTTRDQTGPDADPYQLGRRSLPSYRAPAWILDTELTFWNQVAVEDFVLWGAEFPRSHKRWKGKPSSNGTFLFRVQGRRVPIREFAYRARVGEVPWGAVAVPVCQFDDCVNDCHLQLIVGRSLSPTCPPAEAIRRDQIYDDHVAHFGSDAAARTFGISIRDIALACARAKDHRARVAQQLADAKSWRGPVPQAPIARPPRPRDLVELHDGDDDRRFDV
jgi:hypothetical protein